MTTKLVYLYNSNLEKLVQQRDLLQVLTSYLGYAFEGLDLAEVTSKIGSDSNNVDQDLRLAAGTAARLLSLNNHPGDFRLELAADSSQAQIAKMIAGFTDLPLRIVQIDKDNITVKTLPPVYQTNYHEVTVSLDSAAESMDEVADEDKIDIIIPFYNDKFLLNCLESLERHRDNYLGRLIIIYDQGEVPELAAEVKNWTESRKWAEYYENAENLGFVATCNYGMSLTGRDFILLNTDTLVTRGWLKKLRKTMNSRDDIATVTPLTNQAGYFSLPFPQKPNQDNTPELSNRYLELISIFLNPGETSIESFVGHGFCMFVNKKAQLKIGEFDTETYGRGYGEEVDFSMRATRAGFKHLLAIDTYVYHVKGNSFGTLGVDYNEGKNTINITKYPELPDKITEFQNRNPLKELRRHFSWLKENPGFASYDEDLVYACFFLTGLLSYPLPEPQTPRLQLRSLRKLFSLTTLRVTLNLFYKLITKVGNISSTKLLKSPEPPKTPAPLESVGKKLFGWVRRCY